MFVASMMCVVNNIKVLLYTSFNKQFLTDLYRKRKNILSTCTGGDYKEETIKTVASTKELKTSGAS